MKDEEFLLHYKQEEVLEKLRDYSSELAEITGRLVKTGAYCEKDSQRIHELTTGIFEEYKVLFIFYDLKRGDTNESGN